MNEVWYYNNLYVNTIINVIVMYYETQNEGFDEQYHCFSSAFSEKHELEKGDKILLPSSAFEQLVRLNIEYPMLFELKSENGITHCSVLEFTAPEGTCNVPFWMMQNLLLEEGGLLSVKNVSLPKATYVKIKPLSTDFLNITNPRSVLEQQLRRFSCVTIGDQICLPYNNNNYYLQIQDVQPLNAACIIECDCNVDFDVPENYTQTSSYGDSQNIKNTKIPAVQKAVSIETKNTYHQNSRDFRPFVCNGNQLNASNISNISKTNKVTEISKNTKWRKRNKAYFTGNGHSLLHNL